MQPAAEAAVVATWPEQPESAEEAVRLASSPWTQELVYFLSVLVRNSFAKRFADVHLLYFRYR